MFLSWVTFNIRFAAVFTRLLPSRMVDSSLSGFSNSRATRSAPLTLVLTACRTLTRCSEIKAVSELEKKADSTRQINSNTRYSITVPDDI